MDFTKIDKKKLAKKLTSHYMVGVISQPGLGSVRASLYSDI
jgi:hypothetical protein